MDYCKKKTQGSLLSSEIYEKQYAGIRIYQICNMKDGLHTNIIYTPVSEQCLYTCKGEKIIMRTEPFNT